MKTEDTDDPRKIRFDSRQVCLWHTPMKRAGDVLKTKIQKLLIPIWRNHLITSLVLSFILLFFQDQMTRLTLVTRKPNNSSMLGTQRSPVEWKTDPSDAWWLPSHVRNRFLNRKSTNFYNKHEKWCARRWRPNAKSMTWSASLFLFVRNPTVIIIKLWKVLMNNYKKIKHKISLWKL